MASTAIMRQGIGIPPETEKGHFEEVLKKFGAKHDLPVSEFEENISREQLMTGKLMNISGMTGAFGKVGMILPGDWKIVRHI